MLAAPFFLAAALAAPLDPRLPGAWQCTAGPVSGVQAPVRRFTLFANGTYQAGDARGHYRFDEATGRIDWLNGALRASASQTRYRIDENSKPAIETKLDRREYRCSHAGARPAE